MGLQLHLPGATRQAAGGERGGELERGEARGVHAGVEDEATSRVARCADGEVQLEVLSGRVDGGGRGRRCGPRVREDGAAEPVRVAPGRGGGVPHGRREVGDLTVGELQRARARAVEHTAERTDVAARAGLPARARDAARTAGLPGCASGTRCPASAGDAAGGGDAASAGDAAGGGDAASASDAAGGGDAAGADDAAGGGDAAGADDAAGGGDAAGAGDAAGGGDAASARDAASAGDAACTSSPAGRHRARGAPAASDTGAAGRRDASGTGSARSEATAAACLLRTRRFHTPVCATGDGQGQQTHSQRNPYGSSCQGGVWHAH